MLDINIENRLLCIIMILAALFNINKKFKEGTIMSAVGGLHINLLIFYGIGPLINTYNRLHWDFLFAPNIQFYSNTILYYVVCCYIAFTVLATIFRANRPNVPIHLFANSKADDLNNLNLKVLIISFMGYLFSGVEFSFSGIGTIFPVCKNLLFPCLIMLIYNARKTNSFSIVLLCLGFILVGINAFFSSWRSELILFIFSISIGLVLRNRKFLIYGIVITPLIVVLIMPFQYLKKVGKISKDQNFLEAFIQSINSEEVDRSDISTTFLAFRLNYVRESAYVLRGIDKEYIDYRYGDTYFETVLQLVPRAVWPDKPSYNYQTNRVIPRKIGLVNKLDLYTSWGVNYFAEFLYNFPIQFFPLFFCFYFFLLNFMDRITSKMSLSFEALLLLKFSIFFQALNTVSLTFASTYFLWIFLIVKFIDRLHFQRYYSKKLKHSTRL